MDPDAVETSPVKAVTEELRVLQNNFHSTLESYAARIDSELSLILDAVQSEQNVDAIPASKLRDLRDMLTLLRTFQIHPEKGRRKDLKKIDSLISDLLMLLENW